MTHVHNATHRTPAHIHSLTSTCAAAVYNLNKIHYTRRHENGGSACVATYMHAYYVLKRTTLSLAEPNCRRGVSLVRRILHIDPGKLFLMVHAAFIRMKANARQLHWRFHQMTHAVCHVAAICAR